MMLRTLTVLTCLGASAYGGYSTSQTTSYTGAQHPYPNYNYSISLSGVMISQGGGSNTNTDSGVPPPNFAPPPPPSFTPPPPPSTPPVDATEHTLSGPGQYLWDLSDSNTWDEDGIYASYTMTQDNKGRLTGSGNLAFELDDNAWVTGSVLVKGNVKTSGTVTRVDLQIDLKGTGSYQGSLIKFSATDKSKSEINPTAGMLYGTHSGRMTVDVRGRGKQSEKYGPESYSETLPEDMDGAWVLDYDVTTDAKGRITGTAVVALSNGRALRYNVSGKKNTKTGVSSLTLKPADDSSRNTTLKAGVKIGELSSELLTLSGRVLGQQLKKQ